MMYLINQASFCGSGVTFNIAGDKAKGAIDNNKSDVKCECQKALNVESTTVYGLAICYGVTNGIPNGASIDQGTTAILIMPSNSKTDDRYKSSFNTESVYSDYDGMKANVQKTVLSDFATYLEKLIDAAIATYKIKNILFLGHSYGAALARVAAHYVEGEYGDNMITNLYTAGEPVVFKTAPATTLNYDESVTIHARVSGSDFCFKIITLSNKIFNAKGINWKLCDAPAVELKGFIKVPTSKQILAYNKYSRRLSGFTCKTKISEFKQERGTKGHPLVCDTTLKVNGRELNSFIHNVYQYLGFVANCNCGISTLYSDVGAGQLKLEL